MLPETSTSNLFVPATSLTGEAWREVAANCLLRHRVSGGRVESHRFVSGCMKTNRNPDFRAQACGKPLISPYLMGLGVVRVATHPYRRRWQSRLAA